MIIFQSRYDGRMHGQGEYKYVEGDVYEGQWYIFHFNFFDAVLIFDFVCYQRSFNQFCSFECTHVQKTLTGWMTKGTARA